MSCEACLLQHSCCCGSLTSSAAYSNTVSTSCCCAHPIGRSTCCCPNACHLLRTCYIACYNTSHPQKKREDDVELYPTALNYSSRIFNALKHVVVICSTGLGQLADMEPANALMRTAVNYRCGFCGDSDEILWLAARWQAA